MMDTNDEVIDLKKAKEERYAIQQFDTFDDVLLERNSRDTPLRIWENLERVLDYHHIRLGYNELKKEINGSVKWDYYEDFITDVNTMCRRAGLHLSKDDTYDFTRRIARKKAFNPVKKFLENAHKKYKKEPPSSSVLNELVKTVTLSKHYTAEERQFCEQMLLKWLLMGAAIGMNDGSFECDYSIVFKGEQGVGKTRWCKSLMPKKYLSEFFKDGVQLDVSNKDDVMQCTSYWLVELGEIGGSMRKSDRNALKAWLNSPWDEF
jgi:predicted P-loop ATPase